jgi:hypothetical protein
MILYLRSAASGRSTTDSRIVCSAGTPWHRISRGRSQEVQLGTETNSAYFSRSLAAALPALSLRCHPPSGPLATHEVALTHCWCDARSSLSCTWFDSRGVRVIVVCVWGVEMHVSRLRVRELRLAFFFLFPTFDSSRDVRWREQNSKQRGLLIISSSVPKQWRREGQLIILCLQLQVSYTLTYVCMMFYNLMPLYVAKASSLCTVLICNAELYVVCCNDVRDHRDPSVTRQVSDKPLFFYHDCKANNSWHTQVNTTKIENWKGKRS